MKTKLFRVGRSSVSVILAVMMLLSTMLVGTVTTANAAVDPTKVSKVYVDASVAKYNSSTSMSSTKPANAYAYKSDGVNTYTDENSNGISSWPGAKLKDEGNNIYSILVSNDATKIIFNSGNGGKQTGNLTLPDNWKTTPMIYKGDGSEGSEGWSTYSTTKPVSDSVSLTASPVSVKEGESSTLTAELTNKNSALGDVTYTFTDASGTTVGTKTTSDSSASIEVTPSNTTTYTVTVSADGYDSMTNSTTVTVDKPTSTNYSFIAKYGSGNDTEMGKFSLLRGEYTLDVDFKQTGEYKFYVKNGNNYYRNSSGILTDVSSAAVTLYKYGSNVDDHYVTLNVQTAGTYGIKMTASGSNFLVSLSKVPEPVTKHTVTFGTNDAKMGSVSASDGTALTSPASVEEGKEVTFTANANDGYKFDGWYRDADCTTAITGATDTTYTTTVTDNTTVYAKFVAIDYTVRYTADGDGYTVTNVSAEKANVGDKITFTVTPKTGYQIDSVEANGETLTGSNGSYTFTMPAKNVTITVTASLASYNIANGGDDTLTFKVGDNSVDTAKMGDKVTVSAAKTGYTLTGIEVVADNGDTVEISGLTFTMPASAVTVTPVFEVNNHKITYDATVTGLDSVDVAATADYNTNVAVTVTAKSGYKVIGITVKTASGDSVNVTTTADKYQFTMPDADVIITPSIEVAEIDEPTVDFYGGAGDSTANISANQLYPITAKASAAANSEIQSAVAEITSDNASDATLTKSDTGYNFTSNIEGTFTIKYTVVAVSTLDSSKTSTVEKTITITTTFTETQKAYNTLKAYYDSVKNPTESDYSADAYAALTAKLAEVKTLVEAGLPASSDTDTTKYTTAKSELETLVSDKLLNFYIKGRFRIKNSSGSYVKLEESDATSVNENFKFTSQGNGLYSLDTGCTLAELSAVITGTSGYQYFFVYNQNNGIRYEPSAEPDKADGKDNALDLNETKSTTGWSGTRFNSTDTSGVVTLWVDATGDTYKFYYTVAVEPKYALAGGLANKNWDTFQKDYLVSDVTSYGRTIFSRKVTVTDTTYFNLINSSNTRYGSSNNKVDEDMSSHTSQSTAYTTSTTTGTEGTALKLVAGKYTLYVDQSGSTPKIWAEPIRDTKNVTFSITGEGTGNVSINGTNVKDTDVQAVEIGKSYTITLTPDADSYVESFKVGGETVSGNTYTGTMPEEDITVTVVFAKKALHAIQVTTNDGGKATADLSNAYSGQKVTVTVSADSDHVYDSISVKENASQNTVTCTKNDDGTYSFEMPDDDVNVYVSFREKETYTVTVSSENQQLGTVALDDSEDTLTKNVKEGDTVTIKATAIDPNSFSHWTISGKYEIKNSGSASDAELTIAINGNVRASASFTETAPYQVAYGSDGTLMRMNKTKYDGVYISTGTIVHSSNDSNPNSHFTIYDTANNKFAVISANGYYWFKDDNLSKTMGDKDSWKDAYEYGSNKGLINNACSSAKYVVYNANTKTITLTDDPGYGTKVTLYVKNGTYSTSFDTGNTKDYAKSSVADGLTTTKTSPCNTYSVAFDTNVNVQTTLTEKYRQAGYYVGAYCVNGRNYTASAKDADQGIYQANITITEDLAENGVVEVTPVYYNRIIEQNGDYITFYVDADQAVSDWGNTIAVDAYCYVNGVQTNADHLFGTYPGQPMVRDGRYYVINVPRYRYYIGTDGSLVKDTNSPVSGVTLNNYNNEKIHGDLVPIKRNMQTYDFSDFVKLANLDGVKTIMFQNQFYNADSTAKRNMSVVYGVETGALPSNAATSISNIANANVNPWQDFTDYYGRYTDALGNILSDEQVDDDCLYIISTGSFNSTAYSTKGEWVTIWNVYDHNGKLVTYGTPADFLDSTTSQYQTLNTDAYLGKPVKISYEKGQLYSKANTSRTDGRWFYSKLGQEFTSDVAIEYKYQDDTDYTADTDSNADNNTGFVGTTTKATATINNVTTASFTSVTETAHLNVKVTNGWRFDGWYIKQGDKYTKISDDYTNISADVLMSNSYHIIARVSEIPSGTLELDHTAYTGTDPASHSGTGFYYISAILYNQDGSIKKTFTETQGKISIDDYAATDELEITLRAVGHGDNTIYAVYEGEDNGYFEIGEEDYRGLPNFSYTFTVPAGSLFRNDKLMVNALNYYTDIVKVGGTCDITYKYNDRFNVEGAGNMVSYVVRNVELSSEEIQKNYQPSDDTITKYAPRIDTMYVDTKWVLTDAGKVDKGKSQATVIATQTNKMCKVYHPALDSDGNYTEIADSSYYTVEFNSLLINSDGSFMLSAPEKSADGTKLFSYWNVYKVNEDGEKTDELVTKCYERNFGLRIMADYYIEPVYDDEIPTLTANINSPVMNREVYGESTSATDKVYVDLLTAFTSTAIPTFKENTTDLYVECGVFVVRNNTNTLTEAERNQLVAAAQAGEADTTSSILANHHINDEAALLSELNALVKNESVKNNANVTYDIGDENVRVTKYVFNNDALTNKNRIDKVIRYTNNTANQNYIFSAYAYVIIRNADGSVNEVVISDAQYYNICYVGNKA